MQKNENQALLYETLAQLYKRDQKKAYAIYSAVALRCDITRTLPEIINTICDVTGESSFTISEIYYKVRSAFSSYSFTYHIISENDKEWPLKAQADDLDVHFLYAAGDLSLLSKPKVAVLGMRQPSDQGKENAVKAIDETFDAGGALVGTLDIGLDVWSLLCGYNKGMGVIATLASPLHQCVPESQKEFMVNIARRGGLLITSFPPSSTAQKWFSVPRNRLLVSLADLVAVAEEKDGGPLWTLLEQALKLNKKAFIFSSMIEDPAFTYASRYAEREGVQVYMRKGDIKRVFVPRKKRTEKVDYGQLDLFDEEE